MAEEQQKAVEAQEKAIGVAQVLLGMIGCPSSAATSPTPAETFATTTTPMADDTVRLPMCLPLQQLRTMQAAKQKANMIVGTCQAQDPDGNGWVQKSVFLAAIEAAGVPLEDVDVHNVLEAMKQDDNSEFASTNVRYTIFGARFETFLQINTGSAVGRLWDSPVCKETTEEPVSTASAESPTTFASPTSTTTTTLTSSPEHPPALYAQKCDLTASEVSGGGSAIRLSFRANVGMLGVNVVECGDGLLRVGAVEPTSVVADFKEIRGGTIIRTVNFNLVRNLSVYQLWVNAGSGQVLTLQFDNVKSPEEAAWERKNCALWGITPEDLAQQTDFSDADVPRIALQEALQHIVAEHLSDGNLGVTKNSERSGNVDVTKNSARTQEELFADGASYSADIKGNFLGNFATPSLAALAVARYIGPEGCTNAAAASGASAGMPAASNTMYGLKAYREGMVENVAEMPTVAEMDSFAMESVDEEFQGDWKRMHMEMKTLVMKCEGCRRSICGGVCNGSTGKDPKKEVNRVKHGKYTGALSLRHSRWCTTFRRAAGGCTFRVEGTNLPCTQVEAYCGFGLCLKHWKYKCRATGKTVAEVSDEEAIAKNTLALPLALSIAMDSLKEKNRDTIPILLPYQLQQSPMSPMSRTASPSPGVRSPGFTKLLPKEGLCLHAAVEAKSGEGEGGDGDKKEAEEAAAVLGQFQATSVQQFQAEDAQGGVQIQGAHGHALFQEAQSPAFLPNERYVFCSPPLTQSTNTDARRYRPVWESMDHAMRKRCLMCEGCRVLVARGSKQRKGSKMVEHRAWCVAFRQHKCLVIPEKSANACNGFEGFCGLGFCVVHFLMGEKQVLDINRFAWDHKVDEDERRSVVASRGEVREVMADMLDVLETRALGCKDVDELIETRAVVEVVDKQLPMIEEKEVKEVRGGAMETSPDASPHVARAQSVTPDSETPSNKRMLEETKGEEGAKKKKVAAMAAEQKETEAPMLLAPSNKRVLEEKEGGAEKKKQKQKKKEDKVEGGEQLLEPARELLKCGSRAEVRWTDGMLCRVVVQEVKEGKEGSVYVVEGGEGKDAWYGTVPFKKILRVVVGGGK